MIWKFTNEFAINPICYFTCDSTYDPANDLAYCFANDPSYDIANLFANDFGYDSASIFAYIPDYDLANLFANDPANFFPIIMSIILPIILPNYLPMILFINLKIYLTMALPMISNDPAKLFADHFAYDAVNNLAYDPARLTIF